MDWFVYIVRCADNSLYTGVATDVERRLAEHNESPKGARYTSSRRPVRVVYTAPCANRSEAMKEEWRIKQLTRAEKLALISAWKACPEPA